MLVVRLETRLVLEYYLSVSFVSLFLLFFDFFCYSFVGNAKLLNIVMNATITHLYRSARI